MWYLVIWYTVIWYLGNVKRTRLNEQIIGKWGSIETLQMESLSRNTLWFGIFREALRDDIEGFSDSFW